MNATLESWNRADPREAAESLLPCNGARAWADRLVANRPYASETALLAASDVVWAEMDDNAQQEAFLSHPRLGETAAPRATAQSLHWSQDEQADLKADRERLADLAAANQLYEARFGYVFLACATGKKATELLAMLRARLNNEAAEEHAEAAEQQRRITQLRLRKWLQLPAARCEDV